MIVGLLPPQNILETIEGLAGSKKQVRANQKFRGVYNEASCGQ